MEGAGVCAGEGKGFVVGEGKGERGGERGGECTEVGAVLGAVVSGGECKGERTVVGPGESGGERVVVGTVVGGGEHAVVGEVVGGGNGGGQGVWGSAGLGTVDPLSLTPINSIGSIPMPSPLTMTAIDNDLASAP